MVRRLKMFVEACSFASSNSHYHLSRSNPIPLLLFSTSAHHQYTTKNNTPLSIISILVSPSFPASVPYQQSLVCRCRCPYFVNQKRKSCVVAEDRDCPEGLLAERGRRAGNKKEKKRLNNANATYGSPPIGCCRVHPSLNAV
ncbi:hypothetical protein CC79DRAFT_1074905 [Sarocladium strictum]